MITNNVTRFLDSKKISYQAFELPVEKLGAQEAAVILGVPANQVYKTIVVQREARGKPILAVVSGESIVDLKKLAAAVGEKKVRLTTQKEAEELTGLLAGGISPLALLNKGFQVILDDSARAFEKIYISGGQRGINILIQVKDLVELTHAKIGPISSPEI
jgi:Cys-tRNA(Pro)/Cys-tRNA(Cys) deacylase